LKRGVGGPTARDENDMAAGDRSSKYIDCGVDLTDSTVLTAGTSTEVDINELHTGNCALTASDFPSSTVNLAL
jgi:hypothetical protein